jgi:hypothetical protein
MASRREEFELAVKTGNRRGWISTALFYLSRRFVEHCATIGESVRLIWAAGLV